MLERLVFIDATSLKTSLVKTTGWAPVGKRLVDHTPFGHWHTQTPDHVRGRLFIAGLGCDGIVAPWVLDGAMNRDSFETYVEHDLAPALKPGQIVIADNLSSHKSARAIEWRGKPATIRVVFGPPPCPASMAWVGQNP